MLARHVARACRPDLALFVVVGALVAGCSGEPVTGPDLGDAAPGQDASVRPDGASALDAGAAPSAGACHTEGDGVTTLVFVNRCGDALEVRGGDIEPMTLGVGAHGCRDIGSATEELPVRRYWGFVGADPGPERHTLAEFTFNTDFNDFDWYNISHVDAHNLTMRITPLARPGCDVLVCDDPALLADCPAVGRFTDGAGALVSCVSPDRDDPDSIVAQHFEACDDGYAWSGDDQRGTDPSPVRACAGEDWEIEFCP